MAGAIYMPEDKRMEGVGNLLAGVLQGYQQKQQLEQIKQFQSAIEQAPSREEALNLFNKIPFQNIDQMNMGRQWLNTVHPPKDTTPKEVSTYDPETGQETKQYVRAGDLPKFGQQATQAGQTLTKPEVADFYQVNPDGTFKAIGKHPLTNRPANSATLEELKLMQMQQTDRLKMEAADRADKRFNAQMSKMAESGSKEQASKDIANLKAYNGVVSSMLNIKKSIGQNGEVILDFGGDSKIADAYREALTNGSEYLKKYKGDINKAAQAALKDAGAFDKPLPETPTPAAPAESGGLITQFIKGLTQSSSQAKPVAPAATPASAKQEDFTVGQIYKNPKGQRAKYLGNGKWEQL